MTILDNFPHECTISRPEYVLDERGADIPNLRPVSTEVKCWVQNATQREIEEFQKEDQLITHKVLFVANPPLKKGDVITVTQAEDGIQGKQLKFHALTDRTAGLGVMWRAMCEEEKNPRNADLIPS